MALSLRSVSVRPRTCGVSILALLVVASATVAGAQPPVAPPAQPPPDYSKQAFVIEQSRAMLRFENDGTGRREMYVRVKVQSEAGVQAWGQLALGFNNASERMDIQFVRVHKADGSVMTAPASAAQELSSPVERVAPVYTDFRQKHVTVPGLRPGETLEFSVVTTVHTAAAAGQFWTEYSFRKEGVIILDEQLDIDVPKARAVTLRTIPGADPAVTDNGDRRLYHWTSSNLVADEPTPDDKDDPDDDDDEDQPPPSAVRLTTFQNWDEVARWYRALERGSRTPAPDVARKARELTAGRNTDLARLEALYDFVGPNFRYVSLSLGVGRYQPRLAGDVLRDQYGDCKDKHTLLASMLESLGIPVSTVLINSRTKVDPEFPSPSQFDHVITRAMIAGEPVWVDVTPEVAPFRLLSPNLRDKQALVVDDSSGRLETTPADPPMTNTQVVEVEGTLGEFGRMSGRVKLSFRGDSELAMRTVFRAVPTASWKDVFERMNMSAGLGGEVSDWKVSDIGDTRAPFTVEYNVSKAPLVDSTKKSVDLRMPLAEVELPRVASDGAPKPIHLGSPTTRRYTFKLQLLPDYKARAPLPVSVARDYGQYRATYSLQDHAFAAERSLELRSRELAADRSGDYASFRRVVTADAEQALALEIPVSATTAPSDLKAAELFKAGSDAVRNGNYTQAVVLLERVVELEPKHKTAWNHLGYAYYSLQQTDKAIAAFGRQVALNPYDDYAYGYIGRAHLQERRYAEAEAAFRKQIEINPLEKWAHGSLGTVLLETGRYADAVPEFERAINLMPDNGGYHVQLGTAYLNSGKADEAMAAYDKAASLDPTPLTWNNIAYQLSLKATRLDRAQQLAESAIASVSAASRTFTVDSITGREIGIVRSLASYWDTLGWVRFARGDIAGAEPLVAASWKLGESGEVGDHLGQILEKQGKRDQAIAQYALALNGNRPMQSTRDRLAALAGGAPKADDLVRQRADALVRLRTVPVAAGGQVAPNGTADFFVLFGAGGAPEKVAFAGGDEALKPMAAALLKTRFSVVFPDDVPAKIVRRGTVKCASSCTWTFTSLAETRPPE